MWTITGTEAQQAILRDALSRIKFPLERLDIPGFPEMGWADLNSGWLRLHDDYAHDTAAHPDGDKPEPLLGTVDGRRYVMGVFYPGSARIYVDNALDKYPEIAVSVVAAEIGHAVDEFLPLGDEQRAAIIARLHPDGPDEHTWWEKSDYSAEYYSLVGETFMILFTRGYSDIAFGDTSAFVHTGADLTPEEIRALVGVERTDATPFYRYGKSEVYHEPGHKAAKRAPTLVTDLSGLRPCRVCKPD